MPFALKFVIQVRKLCVVGGINRFSNYLTSCYTEDIIQIAVIKEVSRIAVITKRIKISMISTKSKAPEALDLLFLPDIA